MSRKKRPDAPDRTASISDGIKYVMEGMQVGGGVECPCCMQKVKLYRRKLTDDMCAMLIALDRLNGAHGTDAWIYIGDWRDEYTRITGKKINGGGDYSKLKFWGFVEDEPNASTATGKASSGNWRITGKGRDFVRGRSPYRTAPDHIKVYNNRAVEESAAEVTIQEALGTRFDYNDLMKPTPLTIPILVAGGAP